MVVDCFMANNGTMDERNVNVSLFVKGALGTDIAPSDCVVEVLCSDVLIECWRLTGVGIVVRPEGWSTHLVFFEHLNCL